MLRNTLALLFAAATLAACGGGTSSSASSSAAPISLDGHETVTFETSAGGNGLPGCPAADGAVSDSKIALDLSTRVATRTVETVDCTGHTGSASAVPRATATTTLTASPAQVSALVKALEASSPRHIAECGEDGNIDWLTIDRGNGVEEVYDDDLGTHCAPVIGTLTTDEMAKLVAVAAAPFLVNGGCPMPDGSSCKIGSTCQVSFCPGVADSVACTCSAFGAWATGCGVNCPLAPEDAGTADALPE